MAELSESQPIDDQFARKALDTLSQRLPDPYLTAKPEAEYDYQHRRRLLVKQSWRTEFAAPVRKVARNVLRRVGAGRPTGREGDGGDYLGGAASRRPGGGRLSPTRN